MLVRCFCQLPKSYPKLNGFRAKQGLHFTQNISFQRSLHSNGKHFATAGGSGGGMNIFDRSTKIHQKNVAAKYNDHEIYDYLKTEIAERLVDRMGDVNRFFPKVLDLGAGKGFIARLLEKDEVGTLYQMDSSQQMLDLCPPIEVDTKKIVGNEEILPFEHDYFDLVISSLSLHWINDLPGVLSQIKHCLKDDGVFLGAIFGSDTLFELRCSLQLAEIEREGGFGIHISPFTEMRDVGSLLQRAGLNLTTIDFDEVVIDYPNMFDLMHDLKGMGENNASWKRKSILHRDTLLAANEVYKDMYGNDDGSIPATFQVLYMIGWKPSSTQAKPLERGSGTVKLTDLGDILQEPKTKE